ncbi:ribosomal protein S6 kinase alpha-5-like [Phymastichus coffea]|uniref:ribosomal protein S6 kinase alpha-5-like n=1 Tax=Phymastichus coffea TaxID=108790 RepID=UPI00273B8CF9|nr:ribosomal protein S6 kinase alpha-5-like [Phymastichus coffea]
MTLVQSNNDTMNNTNINTRVRVQNCVTIESGYCEGDSLDSLRRTRDTSKPSNTSSEGFVSRSSSSKLGLVKAINELEVRDSPMSPDAEQVDNTDEPVLQKVNSDIINNRIRRQVDLSDFNLLKVLGTGAYGKVFLVRKKTGIDVGRLYALKLLRKSLLLQKRKMAEHTKTEREVLEAIRGSPYLVSLHYAFQTESKLHLILDYVSGGELFTHVYQRDHFSETEGRIYIGEVILALEKLHSLHVVYRDIKLENILLDHEGHIVLTDFGLSKSLKPDEKNVRPRAYSFCGTIEYMAPEIISNNADGHGLAADWWSLGVMSYELLTGASPFTVDGEKNSQQDISRRILTKDPPEPKNLTPEGTDFICRLLVKNPRERLGGGPEDAAELKNHSFFTKAPPPFSWEALAKREIPPPLKPRIAHELDTSNFADEFTKQLPTDVPTMAPPNCEKLFPGYSYFSPSMLPSDDAHSSAHPDSTDESPFFKQYDIHHRTSFLGDGSFSVCHRCYHRATRKEYAVKIVKRRVDCKSEIALLRYCQGHPNIVKLIEVFEDRKHTYIVMELLTGGELAARIKPRAFSEYQIKCIMRQLASAVQFIHLHGIVHRDLKPENIVFLNSRCDAPIKIVDFGFARTEHSLGQSQVPGFTLPYAAPEVLAKQHYSQSCDMWSLGAIMHTLIAGRLPYQNGSADLVCKIKSGDISFNEPYVRNTISALGREVLKGLLTLEPTDRLSAISLVNHPWLNTDDSSVPQLKTVLVGGQSQKRKCSSSIREADEATLAQRRKMAKHSSSSSSSSTLVAPTSDTCLQLKPPASFDSSSQSYSLQSDFEKKKIDSKRVEKHLETQVTHSNSNESFTSQGPVTRSKKRKLAECSELNNTNNKQSNCHRKQKIGNRPQRPQTIVIDDLEKVENLKNL